MLLPPVQMTAIQHVPPPLERSSNQRLCSGFTLLELSIVLVIIGLLIGGVFVGQSLIKNAQLNAVITEFNRWQTAVNSFQQQYNALPGDITNATTIWGSAGGSGLSTDASCAAGGNGTTATCNGNGDGLVCIRTWETVLFWKHLANAKMIEGSYTGAITANAGTWWSLGLGAGVNVPASKLTPSGWSANAVSCLGGGIIGEGSGGNGELFQTADYGTGHVLQLGVPNSGWAMDGASITPKDAWSIDKKIDDGKPGQGNVLAVWYSTCTTAASNSDLSAAYALNSTGSSCSLAFIPGF